MEIADAVQVLGKTQDKTSASTATMALILIVSALIISVALAVILGLLIRKSIAVPIKEIGGAMVALTNGELDKADVTYTSKDELGDLSEDMRHLTTRLQEIIHEVSEILGEMGNGNFRVTSDKHEIYVGSYRNVLLAMQNIKENLSDALLQINQSADQVSSGSDQVFSGAAPTTLLTAKY